MKASISMLERWFAFQIFTKGQVRQSDSKPIYQLVTERRFRRVQVATQLSGHSFCFQVKTFILERTISPDPEDSS